jgi:hypothetical protein
MCILCDPNSLRLLVARLDTLSFVELADAIGVAREAAAQLVLDTADSLRELYDPDAALETVGADGYVSYVVDRAERDGVASAEEVRDWQARFQRGSILADPRVQAFLSSSTEGLAAYMVQMRERQLVLERFLEVQPGDAVFGGIGTYGEISFNVGDLKYIVLSDEEAMQIAVDRISDALWEEDTAHLLRYSRLPDDAIDILTAAQQRPHEEANDILAGIIDVRALAEDTVRQTGYGRFVAEGLTDDFDEQRFGDLLVVRLRLSDALHDEG